MANIFDTGAAATCSSSSSPPETTDDISLFLRQILLKSSSSSSSSTSLAAKQVQCEIQRPRPLQSSGLSIPDRIHTFSSPAAAYFPANAAAAHVSSSSAGTLDNDLDDYDCESEEGFENLMEEMAAKPNPPRNPSKRSRAAEVHNLSEKRRRSRINEKMKALQKLIPNSNKTDKASMLDEAIEYLKQLQLQVQMLTMRNGINLYSMCVPPGVLQQNQFPQTSMGSNENGSMDANMTAALTLNQESLANTILSLPIQHANQTQPSASDFSHIINPDPSFRLESTLGTQHGSFQFSKSTKEFCGEGTSSRPRIDVNSLESNSLDFQRGTNISSQGHQSKGVQLMNSPILPLDLDGSHTRNESYKEAKKERMPF